MKHDPERAAAFFDEYGEREWTRFDDDRTPSTSLGVHLEYLRRHVRPGDRMLDIGAGPGRFTIELARLGASIVVADISPGQVALNREKALEAGVDDAVTERVVADIVELPFEDGSFDVTICYGGPISYAVDRADDAVAELARVTRPGGHVLVSVMSLVGALQAYADAVLEVTGKVRRRADRADRGHGTPPGGSRPWPPGDAPVSLARAAGAARAARGDRGRVGHWTAPPLPGSEQPELRALLGRLELELAAEPGALDCGPHVLAVVRRHRIA